MTKKVPTCPECGSTKTWKDGTRITDQAKVQRYFCRECSYRFNETGSNPSNKPKQVQSSHRMALNTSSSLISNCQICVSDGEMKNLAKVETKTETRTSPIAEKIVNYLLYLKRLGRKDSTIETYNSYITILSKSNLDDPEEIALFINENWKENSTRSVAVCAYDSFLTSMGKTWNKPNYKQESKKPFIPTDEELSQAIITGKKRSMAFTSLLYETGCRTNEAERIQWDDIDYARKKIYIKASKNGNSRFISVSDNLLNMLGRLPRTDKQTYLFPKRGRNTRRASFSKRMKRLARLTNNTRYCKIHFHTFRHAFALRTYHRTKDILHVKTLLGHRSLMTTQR